MAEYLGEEVLNVLDTEFKDYGTMNWVQYFIERYGSIDGSHHKQWLLDQIMRIIKGTPVIIKLASWEKEDGGKHFEYRITLGHPTAEYFSWVEDMKGDIIEGEHEYSYDEGTAP